MGRNSESIQCWVVKLQIVKSHRIEYVWKPGFVKFGHIYDYWTPSTIDMHPGKNHTFNLKFYVSLLVYIELQRRVPLLSHSGEVFLVRCCWCCFHWFNWLHVYTCYLMVIISIWWPLQLLVAICHNAAVSIFGMFITHIICLVFPIQLISCVRASPSRPYMT